MCRVDGSPTVAHHQFSLAEKGGQRAMNLSNWGLGLGFEIKCGVGGSPLATGVGARAQDRTRAREGAG